VPVLARIFESYIGRPAAHGDGGGIGGGVVDVVEIERARETKRLFVAPFGSAPATPTRRVGPFYGDQRVGRERGSVEGVDPVKLLPALLRRTTPGLTVLPKEVEIAFRLPAPGEAF